MKKKGFTLIELIVVIAIIGVLAAILVPAMLGYVRKSKITTANTSAKDIYNAFNVALVDLDSQDATDDIPTDGTYSGQTDNTLALGANTRCMKMVVNYFSDLEKVPNWAIEITSGACTACVATSGKYAGTYPKAMTVDDWVDNNYSATDYNGTLMTYAKS